MTRHSAPTNYAPVLPAFLTTLLFSLSAVTANRAARILGSLEANFARILIAAAILALWAHTRGQGISGAAFPFFLLSGCIGFGIGDVALFHTYPQLGSRLSIMLVHCLAAPMAATTEWLWLGYKLSFEQTVCSGTILVGVALALAPGENLHIARRSLMIGMGWGILAAAGQGMGAVLSRKAYDVARAAGDHIDGITAAYQRILAGVAFAAVTLILHKLAVDAKRQDGSTFKSRFREAFPWTMANALCGPALGVSFYQWALATTPTGVVLPIVALTPLVLIPFARIVEGDRPTPRALTGGIVAVLGAVALAIVS